MHHQNLFEPLQMATNSKIRLLIVDDHSLVRQGLALLLKNDADFEVLDTAHSGEMAVTFCDHYQPDVVLMDLLMPGINGIEATRMIIHRQPQTKIIMLTSALDDSLLRAALQAGANSYLLKTGSIEEVKSAVRRAYHGLPTLNMEATKALIALQQAPEHRLGADLTPRQREVLMLMKEGLSNRMIADRLTISISTVKNHMATIFSKLGVVNRTGAITHAFQNHLFDEK